MTDEIQTRTLPETGSDPLEDLVARFSISLLKKLKLAQANGRSGWELDDWEKQCQQGLLRHVEKGDPRDVAAYCAFMWHHGWSTTSPGPAQSPDTRVREALEAVVSVSQSGADTVSFLVELQRVAKLCASALAALPQPGAVAWQPGEREAVARAIFGDGWKSCANLGPYVQGVANELAEARELISMLDEDTVEHQRDLIEQTREKPPRLAAPSPALDPATVEALTKRIEKAMEEWERELETPDTKTCAEHIARAILASGASNADTSTDTTSIHPEQQRIADELNARQSSRGSQTVQGQS